MTKPGFILGAIISIISGLFLLMLLIKYTGNYITEEMYKNIFFAIIGLTIGIVLMFANTTSNKERQEYEDYKRMKRQETAMYYRFKDAKGTPFEEYNMDDRTKLMVYYDRLPPDIKKKIVDDVDRMYRKFVNDLYTKK